VCGGRAGIIDVVWKDENEVWAVGGAGSMYVSKDGGKTFTFNKSADDVPGNLYKVRDVCACVGEGGLVVSCQVIRGLTVCCSACGR
jgi:photosystem II stability/assembly factor-like uncharacterized protein